MMADGKKKRILLVEDDRDIREALFDVLQLEGYDVDSAGDGHEALKFLAGTANLPDLILLDLMMPVKDGFQFRAEQTVDPKISHIPVVVMSADHQVEKKSGQLKVNTFLKKPVEIDALLATVEKLCS